MNTPNTQPPNPPRPKRPSRARASILASWRGIDLSDAEKLRRYRPKPISHLTESLVKQLNLPQKASQKEIPKVWMDSIDPRISAHAQPTGLRNGTLFVTVDTSVWLHEILRYHRPEILSRMQNSFGKAMIKRISFRVG